MLEANKLMTGGTLLNTQQLLFPLPRRTSSLLHLNLPGIRCHYHNSPRNSKDFLSSNSIPKNLCDLHCGCSQREDIFALKSNSRKKESSESGIEGKSFANLGVVCAVAMIKFYKREISPYIPASCRYVPTCSDYAIQSYKKYGFFRGSVLTTWRLLRCNPLGRLDVHPFYILLNSWLVQHRTAGFGHVITGVFCS